MAGQAARKTVKTQGRKNGRTRCDRNQHINLSDCRNITKTSAGREVFTKASVLDLEVSPTINNRK